MFWRNKQSNNWILVFFGLIALGIILAVGIVIVQLLQTDSVVRQSLEQVRQDGGATLLGSSPAEVKETYHQMLSEYVADLETESEWTEQTLSDTKEFLQTVRVPKEKLDAHLSVFLRIQQMVTTKPEMTDEIQREIVSLLKELI